MRRKDKEIKDKKELELIIRKANVCRIALSDNNMPYIVPVNFGYKDNSLYIHSATEGKKIEIIKKNNNVCFEMDIDHELSISEAPCSCSMKYRSIIGFGKAFIVEDLKEKQEALDVIVNQYFPNTIYQYNEKRIRDVLIIKVKINYMTGKKSE